MQDGLFTQNPEYHNTPQLKRFEITFRDEIEVESEEEVVSSLIQYLSDCVKFEDVSAFGIYKLKENENA